MYRTLERRLIHHVRDFLRRTYDLDLPKIVVEQPPKVELGEYAMPLAFELAKKLRKAPRKIAEEIVAGIGPIEGFEKLEVAGAGYINARVQRGAVAAALLADENPPVNVPAGKILVEHSSINPNKAAHIGHLRNAILGDTFVRLLRFAGREVDVRTTLTTPAYRWPTWSWAFSISRRNPGLRLNGLPLSRALTTTAGISTRAPRSGMPRTSRTSRHGLRPCTKSKPAETKSLPSPT